MPDKKTLTFVLMDAPYENARTTTALRLMKIAAERGHQINVFAYEGAVYLPFSHQKAHPNPVHGKDAEEEDHVLPREWVAAVMETATENGGGVDWINCGFCVDERGAHDAIPGVRRGGPPTSSSGSVSPTTCSSSPPSRSRHEDPSHPRDGLPGHHRRAR